MKTSKEVLEQKAELKRKVADIVALCKSEKRKLTEVEETEVANYKAQIEACNNDLQAIEATLKNNNNNQIHNKMEKKFSLVSALRAAAVGAPQSEENMAVLNLGREQFTKNALQMQGQIQLPLVEDLEMAITYGDNDDKIVSESIFDVLTPLRANSVLSQAGARFITGAKGIINVPSMGDVTVSFEGENATTSDSTPTFTPNKFTPKRLSCVVPISKMMLETDSVGIENLVRNLIVEKVSEKIEETVLSTSNATATTPAGLLYSAEALANVSTYADLCNIEALAEEANINGGKWIVSPKAKAVLRSMTKGRGNAIASVYLDGEIDGTPVLSTSNVKNNGAVFGDFRDYAVVFWGGSDIIVDPYTLANQGIVRIVLNLYTDMKALRATSFKPCNIVAAS